MPTHCLAFTLLRGAIMADCTRSPVNCIITRDELDPNGKMMTKNGMRPML